MFRMARATLLTATLTLIADQLSKWWLLDLLHTQQHPFIEVAPFFNLVMVWNRGVSFGLLSGANARWFLIVVSLVIVVLLLRWDRERPSQLHHLGTGLICGGAIGNVIDRLRFGAVADFFDVHLAGFHWPAFNIADSAIVVGVALLLIREWRDGGTRQANIDNPK